MRRRIARLTIFQRAHGLNIIDVNFRAAAFGLDRCVEVAAVLDSHPAAYWRVCVDVNGQW